MRRTGLGGEGGGACSWLVRFGWAGIYREQRLRHCLRLAALSHCVRLAALSDADVVGLSVASHPSPYPAPKHHIYPNPCRRNPHRCCLLLRAAGLCDQTPTTSARTTTVCCWCWSRSFYLPWAPGVGCTIATASMFRGGMTRLATSGSMKLLRRWRVQRGPLWDWGSEGRW